MPGNKEKNIEEIKERIIASPGKKITS